MWAKTNGLVGEQIALGGARVPGFSLSGPNDDVWTTLSAAQQSWVSEALNKLNDTIMQKTGSRCATWGPSITAAGGCFKQWFNANYGGKMTGADGKPMYLTPTTVFDQGTLDALITVVGIHQLMPAYPGSATPAEEKKGLSKGAMIAAGVVGAVALGGLAYAATRRGRR